MLDVDRNITTEAVVKEWIKGETVTVRLDGKYVIVLIEYCKFGKDCVILMFAFFAFSLGRNI